MSRRIGGDPVKAQCLAYFPHPFIDAGIDIMILSLDLLLRLSAFQKREYIVVALVRIPPFVDYILYFRCYLYMDSLPFG